jgi:hypothetical protein
MIVEMHLSECDNTEAWGEILGRHPRLGFIGLAYTGSNYWTVHPGMLVSSSEGERLLRDTGVVGLGVVVGVQPHPDPLGDRRYRVLVLWNWDR